MLRSPKAYGKTENVRDLVLHLNVTDVQFWALPRILRELQGQSPKISLNREK